MDSIVLLIKQQTHNAADGTGIKKLVALSRKLLQTDTIPQYLIEYVENLQQQQFGGYPDHKDIAPSAVFTAVFAIFFIAYTAIFIRNWTRGHKFWPGLFLILYSCMRWLGFALRIVWAKNITKIDVGLASEVMLILPIVLLATINLILAQRVFTWAHPVGGNSWPYWIFMSAVYFAVFGVVLMTIVAGVVPYLYYLSHHHYAMCRAVVKASCIFDVLYTLTAISLMLLSWLMPATENDKNALVHSPTWIQSFDLFYYPPKNAPQEAEREFVAAHGDTKPIRTITFVHSKQTTFFRFFKFTNMHSAAMFLIARTSILILIGAMFRTVGMFMDRTVGQRDWIYKPVVMYVLWGVLETIINVLYLMDRIDLRFYKPDPINYKKYSGMNLQKQQPDLNSEEKNVFDDVNKPQISMRSSNTE